MPSELENAMGRFRTSLLRNERAAASQMVRVYGGAWTRLQPLIARELAGSVPFLGTRADDFVQKFGQDIGQQVEAELRRFAGLAAENTVAQQRMAVDAALANSGRLIELAGGPSVGTYFNRLNPAAVENLVGYASDGSPLRAIFEQIAPGCANSVTDVLAQGIVLGLGPRVVARQMRAAFGTGLTRALVISRTETLRAYRTVNHLNYEAHSDVLEGWVWVCACSRRSCGSCYAMHGSFHTLDERLDDHPNGRCAPAPKVKGRPSRIQPLGAERFAELSEGDQRNVLGPGMHEAWKEGRVSLTPGGPNSIVGRKDSAQWGTMRFARPLRDFGGVGVPAVSGQTAVVRQIEAAEKALVKLTGHEELYLIDAKTGELITHSVGAAGEVGVSKEYLTRQTGNIVTHNHPYDVSLSPSDIDMYCDYKLKEVRAVSAEHTYTFSADWSRIDADQLKKAYHETFQRTHSEFVDLVIEGKMETADARATIAHHVMSVLNDTASGVHYERIGN